MSKAAVMRDVRYNEALKRMRKKDADLAEVAELLTAAHDTGDARATYALATWHLHGRHFTKNVRKALSLMKQAADQNVPDALFDLAVSYEKGEGLAANEKKAAALYLRAALQGEKQSVLEVARCYYHGIGVEKDRNIARVWQDRAHELGVDS